MFILYKYYRRMLAIYVICQSFAYSQISLNEFMASNNTILCDDYDEFDDWVELGNSTLDTINLLGWYISDDQSDPFKHEILDSIYILPDSVIIMWADNDPEQGINHLSFKLSSQGEEIIISNPDQFQVDHVIFGEQISDISYGRSPDFFGEWGIMSVPTPGNLNSQHDQTLQAEAAIISPQSGIYVNSALINVSSDHEGSVIYYTLDGSTPSATNMSSLVYTNPILVDETTILKSMVYAEGVNPSVISTEYYIIDNNFQLPIVALGINPSDFPLGNDEYSAEIIYFDGSGEVGFKCAAGLEKHGSSSPQNPYMISFKSEYGQSHIDYPLFDCRDYTYIKRLVLRNASNDRFPGLNPYTLNRTHLRDILIHELYKIINPGGGYSAFKSVNLYINNDYYGIYHIRERQDKYYVKENFGYEDVDLLERAFGFENNRNAIEGDWTIYDNLEHFVEHNDMELAENFEYLKSQIRYNEFLDYWILQIFVGNFDWLSNNVKVFRPRSGEDKWRWLIWDVDHGLGMEHQYGGTEWGSPDTDYLTWSTGIEPPRVWNGDNNRIIRAILRNEQGKIDFINRFQGLMNTHLREDHILLVLDSLKHTLSSDMHYHSQRWSVDIEDWHSGIINLQNYIVQRVDHVWEHLKNKFDLNNTSEITLRVLPFYPSAVKVNNTLIDNFPWTGKYFNGVPMEIKAKPKEGFRFIGWQDLDYFSDTIYLDSLPLDTTFTLVLSPEQNQALVINEFLAINNGASLDPFGEPDDFIELYNGANTVALLSGLILTDNIDDVENYEPISFDEEISLSPGERIVFWADNDIEQGYRHLNFKINGDGESIYLLDQSGTSILDSINFNAQGPDISFGRYPDGSHNWFSMEPTPNTRNIGDFPEIHMELDTIDLPPAHPYEIVEFGFQIANTGHTALIIDDFYAEDNDIKLINNLPFIIQPGIIDSMNFTFFPKELKDLHSTVHIATNDPYHYSLQLHVSGVSELVAHAVLYEISDLPNDNGFNVRLKFLPSMYDSNDPSDSVIKYSIWRSSNSSIVWDSLATLSPTGDSVYSTIVSTSCNSIGDESCLNDFRVLSELQLSGTSIWSNTISGESRDNVAPNPPTGLSVHEIENVLIVNWFGSSDSDLSGYKLEISRDSLFAMVEPHPDTLILDTQYIDTDFIPGDIKYYRLLAMDHSFNSSDYSSIVRYPSTNLSNLEDGSIPENFRLHQNTPNPFNPVTTIRYDLPIKATVDITIYDIMGRSIRDLIRSQTFAPGSRFVEWDGTNNGGKEVSGGVYLYTIESRDFRCTKKLVILK